MYWNCTGKCTVYLLSQKSGWGWRERKRESNPSFLPSFLPTQMNVVSFTICPEMDQLWSKNDSTCLHPSTASWWPIHSHELRSHFSTTRHTRARVHYQPLPLPHFSSFANKAGKETFLLAKMTSNWISPIHSFVKQGHCYFSSNKSFALEGSLILAKLGEGVSW